MTELHASKNGPPEDQASFKRSFAEFEKAFRELKSELYMKRNEVTKLKSDLEEAHHENHNLKQSLDKLKKASDENKITMEMFMKRSNEFEPKYYEKRDALVKLELQYKMETSKNNALREDFQKMAMEKLQLIRKVDVLEEKRKRDLLYSNDIAQKLAQLKSVVAVIKNDIQTVKNDQHQVATLSKEVDLAQESVQKCQELSNIINNLKLEKDTLEEQSVKYKAKSDLLESYIFANNRVVREDNLEARIILTQCKKMSAHYRTQVELKNEIITSLNDNLCREKATNIKLIEDTENKCKQISDLETMLRQLEPKAGEVQELPKEVPDLSIVKRENEPIIEILDSQ